MPEKEKQYHYLVSFVVSGFLDVVAGTNFGAMTITLTGKPLTLSVFDKVKKIVREKSGSPNAIVLSFSQFCEED